MTPPQREEMSSATIQQYLAGIEYPADRQRLFQYALDHGAQENVASILLRIPPGAYDTEIAVRQAIDRKEISCKDR